MARGVALFIVGSTVLGTLAGCGRTGWFEEREPWRHEAEAACIKSGAVKQGPSIAQIQPINGPGVCGADFPLKVAVLGESSALGYADDPRPPGAIPQYSSGPRGAYPPAQPPYAVAPPPRAPYAPVATDGSVPLSITPPGVEPPIGDGPGAYVAGPSPPPSPYSVRRPAYGPPPEPYPPAVTVPLAPSRAGPFASSPATLTPAATLACPLVSALDNWIATAVQPAAQRWFGQPVVEIRQISAYACRSMNGQRDAQISEHAFGNAIDIAAFILADGRKIVVKDGWRGLAEERGFLHDIHAAACQQFSTVLAPGADAFHYDHIHVDLARRTSGRNVCKPAPVPGDLIGRRPGDPYVTGSVGIRRGSRFPAVDRPTGPDGPRPRAVAGED